MWSLRDEASPANGRPAYRAATRPLSGSPTRASSPRVVYHTLLPHPAFAPPPDASDPATVATEAENEAVYRQLLVQAVLAVLLPAEDLRDSCLRTLVADVLGDLILGTAVGGRAAAPWMLWENIARAAEGPLADIEAAASGRGVEEVAKKRLRRLSRVRDSDGPPTTPGPQARSSTGIMTYGRNLASLMAEAFWRTVGYLLLAGTALRFVVEGLVAAAAAPSRDERFPEGATQGVSVEAASGAPASRIAASRRPILAYALFGLVGQLLELSERMPWTAGLVALGRHHLVAGALRVGARDGLLDK